MSDLLARVRTVLEQEFSKALRAATLMRHIFEIGQPRLVQFGGMVPTAPSFRHSTKSPECIRQKCYLLVDQFAIVACSSSSKLLAADAWVVCRKLEASSMLLITLRRFTQTDFL
jgi:hypothetical protein